MPTIAKKEELLELLKQPKFVELLSVTSEDDFRVRFKSHDADASLCYPDDEADPTGVFLFQTPTDHMGMGDPWGSWLSVETQFGSSRYPFLVRKHEYLPQGHDVDVSDEISCRTLGEALDEAFSMHEGAASQLDEAILFDQRRSYLRADKIAHHLSESAYAVDLALGIADERLKPRTPMAKHEFDFQTQVLEKAWATPIPLPEALDILRALPELIKPIDMDYPYEAMHAAASEINKLYFAGKGKLISYTHPELQALGEECGIDVYGTVFVAIEAESGERSFISADCGVHDGFEGARQAVADKISDRWASTHKGDGLYWLERQELAFEVSAETLHVTEAPAVEVNSDYDDNPQWLVSRAIVEASRPYRSALQDRVEASLRADQNHVIGSKESLSL